MSFWTNTVGGSAAVDDGWEDDIDLSDEKDNEDDEEETSVEEDETSVEGDVEEATTTIPTSGLLLGRFTRFFEQPPDTSTRTEGTLADRLTSGLQSYLAEGSTYQEEEVDEEENGWQEEEELFFEDTFESPEKPKNPPKTPETAQVSLGLGTETRQSNLWDSIAGALSESVGLDTAQPSGWDDPDLAELDVSDDHLDQAHSHSHPHPQQRNSNDEAGELSHANDRRQLDWGELHSGDDNRSLQHTQGEGWDESKKIESELDTAEDAIAEKFSNNEQECVENDLQHDDEGGGWDDPDIDDALNEPGECVDNKHSEHEHNAEDDGSSNQSEGEGWDEPDLDDVFDQPEVPSDVPEKVLEGNGAMSDLQQELETEHRNETDLHDAFHEKEEIFETKVSDDDEVHLAEEDNYSHQQGIAWEESSLKVNGKGELVYAEPMPVPSQGCHESDVETMKAQDTIPEIDKSDAPVLSGSVSEDWNDPDLDTDDTMQVIQSSLKEPVGVETVLCHDEESIEADEGAWDDLDLDGIDGSQNSDTNTQPLSGDESADDKEMLVHLNATFEVPMGESQNRHTITTAVKEIAVCPPNGHVEFQANTTGMTGAGEVSTLNDTTHEYLENGNRNAGTDFYEDSHAPYIDNAVWEQDNVDLRRDHVEDTAGTETEESDIDETQTLSTNNQRSVAFAANRHVVDSSHLVDHVPANAPLLTQRDSTIAIGSTDSGTLLNDSIGDELEVMDPDAQDFGPVVDHLPSPHQPRTMFSRTASVITQIHSSDLDGAIELDEQSSTSSYRQINVARPAPTHPTPVVDHVPVESPQPWPKDSTLAVASEQSSTIMEDVWREDFDPEDQDYGPVVDNVPTQRLTLLGRGGFRNIEASIEELDDESADEEKKDNAVRVPPSVASVADSMDVFAPATEIDDDEENTIDRTENGVDEAEAMSHAPPIDELMEEQDKEPQLVDHVPFRPESRTNDASTLGFVDPSEGSTVGDLTHEENVYLPVVDHTPPLRSLMPPSTTESVIVAATKSECPEELEFPEDAGDIISGDDDDDGATLDTRSIGEQINDTKVVDHVPNAPGLRRINSEMATTDVQSIMSPTSFGLVVDVIPLQVPPPSSRDSIAPLATLSEGETLQTESIVTETDQSKSNRMVDRLPPNSEVSSRIGSLTAAKSVISEDETLDDEQQDGYGPVVSAVPQSRGGSTHGLLATLSEVDYGTEAATVDGWESVDNDLVESVGDEELTIDQDFDRTPETKNKSVSFRNLDHSPLFLKPPLATANDDNTDDAPYFLGGRSPATPEDTKYYEAGSKIATECSACAPSTSLDCPCVQRILGNGENPKAAIVSVMSPEGFPVDIDYNKLLHIEVTKRLLLEQAVERYQAMVDSLKREVTEKSMNYTVNQTTLQNLETSLQDMTSQFEVERERYVDLREKFATKSEETTRLSAEIFSIREKNEAARSRAENIEQQFEELLQCRHKDAENNKQIVQELKNQMSYECTRLEATTQEKIEQINNLQSTVMVLQKQSDESQKHLVAAECSLSDLQKKESEWLAHESDMREQLNVALNSISEFRSKEKEWSIRESALLEQLHATQDNLSEVRTKEQEWLTQESALKDEVTQLHCRLKQVTMSNATSEVFGEKIASLSKELTEKCTECSLLNTQLASAESRLKELEGQSFTQIKESMHHSKQNEAAVAKLSEELRTLSKLHEEELCSRNEKEKELESQLHNSYQEKAQHEIQTQKLADAIAYKQSLLDEREKSEERAIREANLEKAKLEAKIKLLENENIVLNREVEHAGKRLLELSDTSALDVLSDENRILQETLVANHDKLEEMQDKLEKITAERDGSFHSDLQLALVTKEKDRLVNALQESNNRIQTLEAKLDHEAQSFVEKARSLNDSSNSLRAALQKAEHDLSQNVHELSCKEAELEKVRMQMNENDFEHEEVSEERDSLLVLCHDLERSLVETQRSSEENETRLRAAEGSILALTQKLECVTAERNDLHSQRKELEAVAIDLQSSKQSQLEMDARLLESEALYASLETKLLDCQNELLTECNLKQALQIKFEELQDQAIQSIETRKLHNLESQISTLQVQLATKDEIVAQLKQELDSLQVREKESSVEVKRLRSRCSEIDATLARIGSERDNAIEKMEQSELHASQLSNELDRISRERDEFRQEIDNLEEDNEEILVQLGLTKEQVESFEKEIESLHSELEAKDNNAIAREEQISHFEELKRRLESDLESMKGKSAYDTEQMSEQSETLKHKVNDLTMQNQDLARQLDEAYVLINNSADETHSLLEEHKALERQCRELQLHRERASTDSTARNCQHQLYVDELEAKLRNFDGICKKQLIIIDQLKAEAKDTMADLSRRAADEAEKFQARICYLERICADRDSLLQQRDLAVDEMRRQLESLHNDSSHSASGTLAAMSRQIEDLSDRLQAAEHQSNQHIHRVKELEATNTTAQLDLHATLEKLKATELKCSHLVQNDAAQQERYIDQVKELESAAEDAQSDLQNVTEKLVCAEATLANMALELDEVKGDNATKVAHDARFHESQQTLQKRESQIKELEIKLRAFEGRFQTLESELISERHHTASLSAELQEAMKQSRLHDSEIETLRTTLSSTTQQLDTALASGEREKDVRREISKIRASVDRKADKIAMLEQQLKSLSVELSSNQGHLVAKEQDLQRMSIAFENLRTEQVACTQRVTSQVLDATTNKDEAESSDNMRSLIISLSKALENSESERADAIECLLKERKANTDSLKRLGESVKRFYSTLNSANTP